MTGLHELDKGDAWEYRVQRAVFLSGWYTRRGVNLRERVAGSPQTMAEVDIFGVAFDPAFAPTRLIGECKNRKGNAKEADRVVWLMGLKEILKAHHVLLAKPSIAAGTYQWSRPFEITLWDEAAVQIVEQQHGLPPEELYLGSLNPKLWKLSLDSIREHCSENHELRRAWDYITGSFWYAENTARMKRLPAYFAAVSGAQGLAHTSRQLLEAQGIIGFLVGSLTTIGQMQRTSPARAMVSLVDAFSGGVASAQALREIGATADAFYRDALEKVNRRSDKARQPLEVPRLVDNIAQPPSWIHDYIEFCKQLSSIPRSTEVIRYADLVLHQRAVLGELIPENYLGDRSNEHDLLRALKLVTYFLSRAWGVESRVIDAVLKIDTTYDTQGVRSASSASEQASFRPF